MLRLFIAALLPEPIKAELGRLIGDLKPRSRSVRWVAPHNIHLTLKFIGERPEKDVTPIAAILEETIRGRRRFEARLRGVGAFPNLYRPQVIWVGMEGVETAAEMANSLNEKLVPLGIEAERRKFSAHLTLGRLKKGSGHDLTDLTSYMEGLNFEAGSAILHQVALVKSTLTPGGPIYENLKMFELE